MEFVWISVHQDTPHQTLVFSVRNKWNLFCDVTVLKRTQNQTKLFMIFLVYVMQFLMFLIVEVDNNHHN